MNGMLVLAEFNLSDTPVLEIAVPLLGVLLITMGMFMGIRKRRSRPDANISAQDRVDEVRQRQAVRGDLEQLMIEVEQLAKRFGAQLDAKTMQMERMIEEANQKIAELKRLEQAREQTTPSHNPPPASDPTPPSADPNPQPQIPNPETADTDEVLKQKVYDLSERGCDPVEIARMLNEHVGKIELILALRKT